MTAPTDNQILEKSLKVTRRLVRETLAQTL